MQLFFPVLVLDLAHGFSTRDDSVPQGVFVNVWRHFWRCSWGSGISVDWWQRPEELLNILQGTEQPPTITNYAIHNVNSFEVEKGLAKLACYT